MTTLIAGFARYWLTAYGLLVAIYFVFGAIVTVTNRRLLGDAYRIQRKTIRSKDVRRDMRQSVLSLVSIAFFLAFSTYAQARGWTMAPWTGSWVAYAVMFAVSLLVFDAWFYWGHRIAHLKAVYPIVHRWHHQAVTPTVWSNNSDTFLDNCLIQSYFLVATFVLPIPASVLVAHKVFDQITGMLGHSGYEYSPGRMSRFPSPLIGVTFHDRHHEKFNCNFATHFSLWDRWMGTIDPTYDERIMGYAGRSAPAERSPGA